MKDESLKHLRHVIGFIRRADGEVIDERCNECIAAHEYVKRLDAGEELQSHGPNDEQHPWRGALEGTVTKMAECIRELETKYLTDMKNFIALEDWMNKHHPDAMDEFDASLSASTCASRPEALVSSIPATGSEGSK